MLSAKVSGKLPQGKTRGHLDLISQWNRSVHIVSQGAGLELLSETSVRGYLFIY